MSKRKEINFKEFWTDKRLNEVRKMAGQGMTQGQICQYYGISEVSFRVQRKGKKLLSDYYEEGRAMTLNKVTGKLIENIENGCKASLFFYLKTQWGWKEPKNDDNVIYNINNYEFLNKPLKVIDHSGNYSGELEEKYNKIMNIGLVEIKDEEKV